MEACVELGGTISGEHGVGLEKIDAMRMIFSEQDFAAQRALQQAFDPESLLNPGKVIPVSLPKEDALSAKSDRKILAVTTTSAVEDGIIDKIEQAVSNGKALLPTGCGTLRHFGNLSDGTNEFLNSSELNTVIDFDPNNQVITAGAGLSLDKLQALLAERNQWLPIRPPFAVQGHSFGGVMALAACGPERLHYRAPRDMVLGLRFVDGSGQKISTGGKVVKNVSGYDLTRLMIGSAGTLGLITEVTSRIMTMPERCSAISAAGSLSLCAALAGEVIISNLVPVFVTAIPENRKDAEIDDWSWKLLIGFEGFEKIVDEQLNRAARLLEEGGMELQDPVAYPVHDGIFGGIYAELDQSAFVLRADVPLDELAGFVQFIGSRRMDTRKILLDFGCGRVLAGFEAMQADVWPKICDFGDQLGGHVLLEKAPLEFKKNNDVFGSTRPEWKIMHRIKAALDPNNIFAPGRLPGKV
jgi:FAD/FMN-containing dehydrogenase